MNNGNKGKDILFRIGRDIKTFKWLVIALLIYYFLVHFITGAFCPMVIVTGLPCPGCGMTRAALFFMTGQFARGIRANPSILLWTAFACYMFVQRYIRGRRVREAQYLVGAIAAAMIIIYVYRMAAVFPNRAPMSITYRNLLSQLFPDYREFLRGL